MSAQASNDRAFLFAGGGTGGHLFPALAIHEQLRARLGDVHALYLCSNRPIDGEILEREGVEFEPTRAAPFGGRPKVLARFVTSWGPTVREGRATIRGLKAKHGRVDVIAAGGFVAAPIVQAARVEGVPVTMLNLDAVPGKANRWIARHASRVFTTAPVEKYTWEQIPPIVRASARSTKPVGEAREVFGLDANVRTLLVTGGSQGARSINELLMALAGAPARPLSGWQVIHQAGKVDLGAIRSAYEKAHVRAHVTGFITNIGDAWRAADCAVSRAGAGSVAEAWANHVPCLFMPYPYHRDQHQVRNAMPLRDAGGAMIETDHIDAGRNISSMRSSLSRLLDEASCAKMRRALEGLGEADGAERVAESLCPTTG